MYYYDEHGWLTDTPIPGRETDVVPMAVDGDMRPNFTGYKWVLQKYAEPIETPASAKDIALAKIAAIEAQLQELREQIS